jgi:hypothetical protein
MRCLIELSIFGKPNFWENTRKKVEKNTAELNN